jgi:hypothetical protein
MFSFSPSFKFCRTSIILTEAELFAERLFVPVSTRNQDSKRTSSPKVVNKFVRNDHSKLLTWQQLCFCL